MAEAAAKSGNDATALTHLNNFRSDLVAHYGATAADFPASTASGAALLNQILEEKYIALVGELVTFHDLRRTRNLIGVPNKTTGSVGASAFPQKFLYPQSELDTNAENVPQGGHTTTAHQVGGTRDHDRDARRPRPLRA